MENRILNLRWKQHGVELTTLLDDVRKKGLYSDSTISCGNQEYRVHSVLLTISSDFFAQIFKESKERCCDAPFIVINDVLPIHMEQLLIYIYCGEVSIHQDEVSNFLELARALQIKGPTLTYEDRNATSVIAKNSPEARMIANNQTIEQLMITDKNSSISNFPKPNFIRKDDSTQSHPNISKEIKIENDNVMINSVDHNIDSREAIPPRCSATPSLPMDLTLSTMSSASTLPQPVPPSLPSSSSSTFTSFTKLSTTSNSSVSAILPFESLIKEEPNTSEEISGLDVDMNSAQECTDTNYNKTGPYDADVCSSKEKTDEPKYIPGQVAVCNNCGILSEDFNRCQRCKTRFPNNVRTLPVPAASATTNNTVNMEAGRGGVTSNPLTKKVLRAIPPMIPLTSSKETFYRQDEGFSNKLPPNYAADFRAFSNAEQKQAVSNCPGDNFTTPVPSQPHNLDIHVGVNSSPYSRPISENHLKKNYTISPSNSEISMKKSSQCPYSFPHRNPDGSECNQHQKNLTTIMKDLDPKIQVNRMEKSREVNPVTTTDTPLSHRNPRLLVNALPVVPSRYNSRFLGTNKKSINQVPSSLTRTDRISINNSDVRESQKLSVCAVSSGTTQVSSVYRTPLSSTSSSQFGVNKDLKVPSLNLNTHSVDQSYENSNDSAISSMGRVSLSPKDSSSKNVMHEAGTSFSENYMDWGRDICKKYNLEYQCDISFLNKISAPRLLEFKEKDFQSYVGSQYASIFYEELSKLRKLEELREPRKRKFEEVPNRYMIINTSEGFYENKSADYSYMSTPSIGSFSNENRYAQDPHCSNALQSQSTELVNLVYIPAESQAILHSNDGDLSMSTLRNFVAQDSSPKKNKKTKDREAMLKSHQEVPLSEECLDYINEKILGAADRYRRPFNWEFLMRMLVHPETNPTIICWEDESQYCFKLVKPELITYLWSAKSESSSIDKNNFVRGLRYHYGKETVISVKGKHNVYRCGKQSIDYLNQLRNA